MSYNTKLRMLLYANGLLSVWGLFYITYVGAWSQINPVISYLIYLLLGMVGSSLFLHRYLTHRSFHTHKSIEYLLAVLSIFSSVGSPTSWVATHRAHHAFSDQPRDPHSPNTDQGEFSWRIAWQVWNGWSIENNTISPTFARDLLRSKFYNFLHQYYFYILLIPVFCFYVFMPLQAVMYYSLPAFMVYNALQLTNILSHSHGYRNFECRDRSSNSWIVNLLTLGDGWHNNHHANPNDWNFQRRWWEIDFVAVMIRLIKT